MSLTSAVPAPTRGVLFGHPITSRPALRWLDRSAPSPFSPIRIDVADTSGLSGLRGQCPYVEPVSRREPDGTLVLDTSDFGAYVLDAQAGTIIAPSYRAGSALWERRLLNWAIPILLSEQGTLVLHAAGIVTPAGAILIVGESTAGKSTFASATLELGYHLLSEDGVAVTSDESGAGLLAWPGPSGIRLRHRRDGHPAIRRTNAIRPERRCSSPVPLAGVLALGPRSGEGAPVTRLGAAAAVATIANRSFSHGTALGRLYPRFADVARSVPVATTSLRDSLAQLLDEVTRVLEAFARVDDTRSITTTTPTWR